MAYGWEWLTEQEQDAVLFSIVAGKVLPGPLHVELHPTNKCNAQCEFCSTGHLRAGETLSDSDMEDVLALLAEGGLRFVTLIGGGEPLLHPRTDKLLAKLGALGLAGFNVVTNGIMLERYAKALLENGCRRVNVSLNGPRADLYARTMRVSAKNFDRILAGIEKLLQLRDHGGHECQIWVQLFLNDDNIELVPALAEWCRARSVDALDLRSTFPPPSGADRQRITNEREERLFALVDREIARDAAAGSQLIHCAFLDKEHAALNHRLSMRLTQDFPAPTGLDPSKPRVEYCVMPWYSMVVGAKGDVAPCCIMHGDEAKALGDLHHQDVLSIWRGNQAQRLRGQMRQVLLMRGKLKFSPKLHDKLCDRCIGRQDCFLTFGVAENSFCQRLSKEFDARASTQERLLAIAGSVSINAVHRVRALAGTLREIGG